jgi:separase
VTHHQDFVQLSVQLAHEYVKLGKLREAGSVYKRSLSPIQIQTVSSDTRVVLLLRHAESLTRIGDIGQRLFICHYYCRSPDSATSIALYNEALQLSETLPKNEGESSTLDRVHSHVKRLRRAALAASVFAGIKLAQVSFLSCFRLRHVLTPPRMILLNHSQVSCRRSDYGIVLSVRCLT